MVQPIDAHEVIELAERGAAIVDALPAAIYREEHLPGAINVPLVTLTPEALDDFERSSPVVVYCFDQHCDLSARMAHRLAAEGFTDVHDFIGGRARWTALGLPTEGDTGDRRRISNYLRVAPTVPFDATIGDLLTLDEQERLVVVIDDHDIVLGALESTARALPADTLVARAMIPAPGTIRPEQRIDEVVEQLRQDHLDHVLCTSVSGALLGIVVTEELHV
jgi:rhodanese-related sulfurtransferase